MQAPTQQVPLPQQINLVYEDIRKICNDRADTIQTIRSFERFLKVFPSANDFEFEIVLKSFIGTLSLPLLPQYTLRTTMLFVQLLQFFLNVFLHTPNNCGRDCKDCSKVNYLKQQQNLTNYKNLLIQFACFNMVFQPKQDLPLLLFQKKEEMRRPIKKNQPMDVNHFLQLLSNRLLTGSNISTVLTFMENSLQFTLDGSLPHVDVKSIQSLLRLILDPLIIIQVRKNEPIHEQYKGKVEIPPINSLNIQDLEVEWSDNLHDSGRNHIPPRNNGMEVFQLLLLLFTQKEFNFHLDIFLKFCLEDRYTAPYSIEHLSKRIPEILPLILKSGKCNETEAAQNIIVAFFETIYKLLERPQFQESPILMNLFEVMLMNVTHGESLLWIQFYDLITKCLEKDLLTTKKLTELIQICVTTLLKFQADHDDFNVLHSGAILSVILKQLTKIDNSQTNHISLDLVLYFFENDFCLNNISCSNNILVTLAEYASSTGIKIDAHLHYASSYIFINLISYLRLSSHLNLVSLVLQKTCTIMERNQEFNSFLLHLALQIIRCDSTEQTFIHHFSSNDFHNLILLISFGSLRAENQTDWNLTQTGCEYLAGNL